MEKNLELLRPFDLEAAESGEALCDDRGLALGAFYGMFYDGGVCIRPQELLYKRHEKNLRMSPYAWIEGRPVYKGDELYIKDILRTDIITGMVRDEFVFRNSGNCFSDNRNKTLTWAKPKTKREGWVNVYPDGKDYHYETKEEARRYAGINCLASVRIEWEE